MHVLFFAFSINPKKKTEHTATKYMYLCNTRTSSSPKRQKKTVRCTCPNLKKYCMKMFLSCIIYPGYTSGFDRKHIITKWKKTQCKKGFNFGNPINRTQLNKYERNITLCHLFFMLTHIHDCFAFRIWCDPFLQK